MSAVDKFEDRIQRLEEIVNSLESEGIGLEQAMKFFQEGVQLSKSCHKSLEEAEQQVKQLTQDMKENDFTTPPEESLKEESLKNEEDDDEEADF